MFKLTEIKNKKASFEYELIETEVAGIMLLGSEVKSVRNGKVNISEAYCYIKDGEVFIKNMHISEFQQAGRDNHDPYRERKLLLTKKQIEKFSKKLETKGLTIVPVKLFLDDKGRFKLKVALAKGKREFEKRISIKQKDIDRDAIREINNI
jgi:SsrA-binding protein